MRRLRPAKIAASLQMLARSAPLRPLVWRAIRSRSTSSREWLGGGVHVEDRPPALEVGRRDEDLAVEAPGAQQRRVELLEHVRGGDHHHVVAVAEAVELHQQLVERLVLLARDVLAAGGAHRVELVDEDDRRGGLARLAEEAPDARGAEAHEHLDERGGGLREEGALGLVAPPPWPAASCRCREGRAAGCPWARARRAPEALGVAHELHDLAQLVLGLLHPGHVVPADGARRGRLDLLRLGPRHHADHHQEDRRAGSRRR